MNGPTDQRYELWDQFLDRFPLEKLEAMSLEEYTKVGSKDTFCWWIESGTDKLGSIWGGSAFKFGIYARKNTEKEFKGRQYKGDDQYAWLAKYGDTATEAFSTVKSLIATVAQAARQGNLENINQVDLGPAYKWKIAYHYQNRNKPTSLNIFKKEVLAHFLQSKEKTVPPKADYPYLHQEAMRLRNNQDLLEFGDVVWKEGSIFQSYNKLKTDFFKHFPDFTTFTNPTEGYLAEERNYKQELCTIYAEEIAPRLHPLPPDEEELLQLGKDITAFFTRKLTSEDNKPQNLVGWRYVALAKELDDKGQITFARAVSRLTDPELDIGERIPDFVNFLHKHSADGKCGPAATRSLTTFFLFLSDPEVHFFIKTEEITKLLKLFNLDKFKNDGLAPEEYSRVQRLAGEIYSLLVEDGLEPQDMIDVQSFTWSALHAPDDDDEKEIADGTKLPAPQPEDTMNPYPLNQILYGPPGTGKTYITAERAVQICDGSTPDNRAALMQRYRELIDEKRISFVSFHQSFSYEEFIEGIRPELAGQAESEQGQLVYQVEPGLFKKICSKACTAVDDMKRPQTGRLDLTGKSFFQMWLGGESNPEVESFCLNKGYMTLGFGNGINFSGLPEEKEWESARDAIMQAVYKQNEGYSTIYDSFASVDSMVSFKNVVGVGDIVFILRYLDQVQAIGQVTGEYEYRPEFLPDLGFEHFRKVKWLIRDDSIPVKKIYSSNFDVSLPIQHLELNHFNMKYLEKLLGSGEEREQPEEAERYVLIIDEINRANISKVLGELITLIEPDKRLGAVNEVTVKLPYSRDEFGIPANLHIVGTMNTADRSLALLDTALRRRFEFEEMMPDYELLKRVEVGEIKIDELLKAVNQRIEALYDREHTIVMPSSCL